MSTAAEAGLGQSQELSIRFGSSTWMADAPVLEPGAFQGVH